MEKMDFNRKFKFWFYQISHSEAIIRSPKTDSDKIYDTNIDIYLGDIQYIEMPCLLRGLQIDKATKEDAVYLSQKFDRDILVEKIVVLISEGKRFYVIASIIQVLENDLDYDVLPIYGFDLMEKTDFNRKFKFWFYQISHSEAIIRDDLIEKIEFKDRKFKFWFYQVVQSEAIIRSSKTDLDKVYDTTIDIYLGDIQYIEIPWLLRGVQIDKATREDAVYLSQKLGRDISVEEIVVFISEGKRYYVTASIIKIMESNLGHWILPIYAYLVNKDS